MNKGVIIFIVIIIVIGVLGYVYFSYERPLQDKQTNFINLSIIAMDKNTNDIIPIKYHLYNDNGYSFDGMTLTGGASLLKVEPNQTYYIDIFDNNQTKYYNDNTKTFVIGNNSYYMKLLLNKSGEVKVSTNSSLINQPLVLTLKSEGYYNIPIICGKWGIHVVKLIPLDNLNKISIPKEFNNYDVCYELNGSLNNEERKLSFNYTSLGNLDYYDFIDFIVIDRDIYRASVVTSINNTDVGGDNVEIKFQPGTFI